MKKSIGNHPFAFAYSLAWIGFGLCISCACAHPDLPMDHMALSIAVLIIAGLCQAALVTLPLIALIAGRRRKKRPEYAQQRFLKNAARRYVHSTPGGKRILAARNIALLLPFLALVLITLLAEKNGTWIAGLLPVCIGIAVWFCAAAGDWAEGLLLKNAPEETCFRIQSSISPELLDRLADNPPVLGIEESLWQERARYLHSMLLMEKVIDESAEIHCYRIPMEVLRKHWQLPQDSLPDAQVIWLPLKPVQEHLQSGAVGLCSTLAQYQLSAIAKMQYTAFQGETPEDYAFTSGSIRFQLHEDASIRFEGDRLQLFCPSADDGEPESEQIYLGCMMEAAGAAPVRVKYDCFSTWDDEDDSTETDLSREEMQAFLGLLQKGGFDCVVNTVSYHERENLLALEIWGNPIDSNHPLFSEDESGYLLVLRYQKLTACWMATVNMD